MCIIVAFWTRNMEAYPKKDQFFSLFMFAIIWANFSAKCQISRLEWTEIGIHESETSFNPEWDFIRRDLSILNSISHVNTNWVWSVVQDRNSMRIHVNYP